MRGRTNIPPRTGGIVTGNIKRCIVAEEQGISVGNFVQYVQSNGSLDDSQQSISPDAPNWYWGVFKLGNNKAVTFNWTSSRKLNIVTSTVGIQGYSGSSYSEELDVEALCGISVYGGINEAIDLIQTTSTKFLMVVASSTNDGMRFIEIEYTEYGWSMKLLQHTGFSYPSDSYKMRGIKLCKVSNTHIAMAYRKGNVCVGTISEDTIHFGTVFSCSIPSISDTTLPSDIWILDGFICVYYGSYIVSLKANNVTLSQSSIVRPYSSYISGMSKISENSIIGFRNPSDSYSTSGSGYLNCYLVTIDSNGNLSSSVIDRAIEYDGISSSSSEYVNVTSANTCVLDDGKLVACCYVESRTGSSSYKYNASMIFSVGVYDESLNLVLFGRASGRTPNAFSVGQSYSSKDILHSQSFEDYISSGVHNLTLIRKTIAKISGTSVVDLLNQTYAIKHRTKIDGIAKTSGSSGSSIDVYVPYNS